MTPPMEDCIAGLISPEVAIARMLLIGSRSEGIMRMLDAAPEHAAKEAMRRLVSGRQAGLDLLASEVAQTANQHDGSGPTPAEGVARIAAFFDHAVSRSPEASVALYSLGDPAILAAATREIVGWLEAERLMRAGADVLDVGCGIGRVAAALAPRCRSIVAIDVSPGMVAEAQARLAGFGNVQVRQTGGEDLDGFEPASFDLILAVDSFPYIVQNQTALRHVQGAAGALRPGGALCILNLSYRQNPGADRADAAGWAETAGLRLAQGGVTPFSLWDGTAFVFVR